MYGDTMIINTSPFFTLMIQQWRRLLLGLIRILCVIASVALLSLSGWLICCCRYRRLGSAHAFAFNYFLPAAAIRFWHYCVSVAVMLKG